VFRASAADSGADGCRDVPLGSINRLLRAVVLSPAPGLLHDGLPGVGGFLGRGRRNNS
jgi:hypothetical protein